jgi:hypothetical protein
VLESSSAPGSRRGQRQRASATGPRATVSELFRDLMEVARRQWCARGVRGQGEASARTSTGALWLKPSGCLQTARGSSPQHTARSRLNRRSASTASSLVSLLLAFAPLGLGPTSCASLGLPSGAHRILVSLSTALSTHEGLAYRAVVAPTGYERMGGRAHATFEGARSLTPGSGGARCSRRARPSCGCSSRVSSSNAIVGHCRSTFRSTPSRCQLPVQSCWC